MWIVSIRKLKTIWKMLNQFNYTYPIEDIRSMYSLAADVKNELLIKAFYEAEQLDVNPQLQDTKYREIPAKYREGTTATGGLGLDMILCYYAYARYILTSDHKSTSTGTKIQTYGNSIIVPNDDRNKVYEAERGKADILMAQMVSILMDAGLMRRPQRVQYRIGVIK